MGAHQSVLSAKGPAQGGILISRQVEVLELVGFESKNRYHIRFMDPTTVKDCMKNSNKLPSRANGYGKTQGYDLYGMEKSECCERIFCGPNRSLQIDISTPDAAAEPFLTIAKPFSCVGSCICKTETTMRTFVAPGGGAPQRMAHAAIGWPLVCFICSGCGMDVRGHNGNGQERFKTGSNTICCNCAIMWPCCCGSYDIPVVRESDGQVVATISRPQLTCMQICGKMNELLVNWTDSTLSEAEKMVILNMMYCLEFEFFSPQQN